MENASKALVIAGSILLAVLVIGISVFVFNIAKDPVAKTVDNMTKDERKLFNSKFQKYESGRVAGIETKALINISMQNANHQLNLNENARIPEMKITYKDNTILTLTRDEIIKETDPEFFQEKFQIMLNKVKSTLFYNIEINLNAENGIVNEIRIEELSI